MCARGCGLFGPLGTRHHDYLAAFRWLGNPPRFAFVLSISLHQDPDHCRPEKTQGDGRAKGEGKPLDRYRNGQLAVSYREQNLESSTLIELAADLDLTSMLLNDRLDVGQAYVESYL